MIFSSFDFIFIFFPITFAGYFSLQHIKQPLAAKIFLIAASFTFYAIGSKEFFPFFVGSVFINYGIGTLLSSMKKKSKLLLSFGILINVALLGYYKYTNFFLSNVNKLMGTDLPLKNILLPIGISFFTFQLIAFLVDSYRGETENYSIIDYLLFITFFPQLIVGPIVHHKEMIPQFENADNFKLNWNNIAKGLFVFSYSIEYTISYIFNFNKEAEK